MNYLAFDFQKVYGGKLHFLLPGFWSWDLFLWPEQDEVHSPRQRSCSTLEGMHLVLPKWSYSNVQSGEALRLEGERTRHAGRTNEWWPKIHLLPEEPISWCREAHVDWCRGRQGKKLYLDQEDADAKGFLRRVKLHSAAQALQNIFCYIISVNFFQRKCLLNLEYCFDNTELPI